MIDLEKLEALRQDEKDHDELQQLPGGFCEELTKYIRDLKEAANNAANYREGDLIRDQLKSSVNLYEGLMDLRRGKIIDMVFAEKKLMTANMLGFEAVFMDELRIQNSNYTLEVMHPVDAAYGLPYMGGNPNACH